ncbi:MAG: hypothetical protein ACI9K2_000572 [Myxococcota bacterium]|jgi:hypothetical protein
MLAALILAGCASPIDCSDLSTLLVDGPEPLTCAAAEVPRHYLGLLAARPMTEGDRQVLLRHVRDRHTHDPAATQAWLARVSTAGSELETLWGLAGAERRATRVWEAIAGVGVISEADGDAWSVQSRALAVWARDDASKLAITEADVEGWITYASLCREVQGGGVLRLSVADRVTVYRILVERYDEADRRGRIAIAAMGPFWPAVQDGWAMAPYARQQAWIAAAPLPPPMTATSLGYVEALLGGDLSTHAAALHDLLGPLPVTQERRFTKDE